MVDKRTVTHYEENSQEFISRYSSVMPGRLYELMATFFHTSKKTLDIGCASGRDLSYMKGAGFDVEGLDTVESFVKHCKDSIPSIPVHYDSLPLLSTIEEDSFDNILLSAILMHLPSNELIEAAVNILRISRSGARIIISIRNSRGVAADTNREEDGRLFTNIPTGRLISLFEGLGAKAIFNEEQQEENREDVIWHNLVFEKIDTSRKDGIDRIQEILIKDKKTSTYKLALLRGLNYLARHENGIAKYDYDREYVWLPMKRVAFTWIRYYFPLLKRDNPFRQITSAPNLAIQKLFTENLSQYQSTDLSLLIDEYEDGRNRDLVDVVLKEISKTIKTQPVKYTTSDSSEVFKIISKEDASLFHEMDYEAGAIGVPVSIWHDLMLFGSWIDDSLYIQWANFIKNIEKDRNFGEILSALMEPTDDKRSTLQIHKLFKGQTVECIWSGEQISKFDIDHAIPYSLWKNNDLWNLLPCDSSLNSSKTNKLPSLQLLNKRKDCIISYWEIYQKMYPEQFAYQLSKSLGSNIKNDNWKNKSHLNLLETISRLSVHKIGDTWDYI